MLKCCHAFNLLDARGVISATERMAYTRAHTMSNMLSTPWTNMVSRSRP